MLSRSVFNKRLPVEKNPTDVDRCSRDVRWRFGTGRSSRAAFESNDVVINDQAGSSGVGISAGDFVLLRNKDHDAP